MEYLNPKKKSSKKAHGVQKLLGVNSCTGTGRNIAKRRSLSRERWRTIMRGRGRGGSWRKKSSSLKVEKRDS